MAFNVVLPAHEQDAFNETFDQEVSNQTADLTPEDSGLLDYLSRKIKEILADAPIVAEHLVATVSGHAGPPGSVWATGSAGTPPHFTIQVAAAGAAPAPVPVPQQQATAVAVPGGAVDTLPTPDTGSLGSNTLAPMGTAPDQTPAGTAGEQAAAAQATGSTAPPADTAALAAAGEQAVPTQANSSVAETPPATDTTPPTAIDGTTTPPADSTPTLDTTAAPADTAAADEAAEDETTEAPAQP